MTPDEERVLVSLLVWPGAVAEVSARIGEGWSQTKSLLEGAGAAGLVVREGPEVDDRWGLTGEGRALAVVLEVMSS